MDVLHLFAGAGGGLLADLILGHRPVAAVEIDPYCCAVLRKRVTDGWFPGMRVHEGDIRLFDPSEYTGRVDCVSGGFPCQDISAAGKGAGIDGDRSGLWSEFARVIRLVRPRYAFIENSPMLTLRGLDRVLCDLAALGFDAEWEVVSAADAGAPHRRERIWILAHDSQHGRRAGRTRGPYSGDKREREQPLPHVANVRRGRLRRAIKGQAEQPWRAEIIGSGVAVADSESISQREPADTAHTIADGRHSRKESCRGSWWELEPDVGRVAHGVAARVERLKALGNGQVPIQAALAWQMLEDRIHGK